MGLTGIRMEHLGLYKTVNGAAAPKTGSPQSISIYSVPFTRFFGQDVLVCGDGNANRFMFDTTNALKGSYGEYATIFELTITRSLNTMGLTAHW